MAEDSKQRLKVILRESDMPFFSDSELDSHLNQAGGNVELAAYNCLIIKAENTQLKLSGLTTADTSKYFLRLAKMYRPGNTGVLKGE